MLRIPVTATQTAPGVFTLQVSEQTITIDHKTMKALRTAVNAPEIVAAVRKNGTVKDATTHIYDTLEAIQDAGGQPSNQELFAFIHTTGFGANLWSWAVDYGIYLACSGRAYRPFAQQFVTEFHTYANTPCGHGGARGGVSAAEADVRAYRARVQ